MPKYRGFTLIELLLVISIIAVLSVISLATYTKALQSSRDARRKSDLYHIQEALEQYHIKNGSYPVGLSNSSLNCWKNSPPCGVPYNLISSGLLKSMPIDPGTNTNSGGGCGQSQIYMYISTNGVDTSGDGASGKGYRLGAVQETQGTSGCYEADGSTPKCPMAMVGMYIQQYCLTNKQ